MPELIWLNGELVAPDRAAVSVFDHGLTVGDGVFETIKAVDGAPFAVRRHLARLRRSAASLDLDVPHTDEDLRTAIADVLATHHLSSARVRITVTGGTAPLGSDRGTDGPTVIVAAAPLGARSPSTAVCVVPWSRNERGATAGVKTTSYAENVIALAYAKVRDCSEAIFANTAGWLCEGTGSNVFVGISGRLVTPPLDSGCLAGVTRELVIELTGASAEPISMAAFSGADEVFLTSTGRDVQAVHRIDDTDVPAPGPLTAAAALALADLERSTSDP